jgi:ATP-dependent DNA helicase Rep
VKSLLEVAQTIALLSTISERERRPKRGDALHPARRQGLGVAPRDAGGRDRRHAAVSSLDDDDPATGTPMKTSQRLQEERRLMYVGITRAQRTLAVSWTRKRKKGRDMIAASPAAFIGEMALG